MPNLVLFSVLWLACCLCSDSEAWGEVASVGKKGKKGRGREGKGRRREFRRDTARGRREEEKAWKISKDATVFKNENSRTTRLIWQNCYHHLPSHKCSGERAQSFKETISGSFLRTSVAFGYHGTIITKACPPKRSHKALRRKLVPIFPKVYGVGNGA